MSHAALLMATTSVAVIVFIGLAIYVVTGNPRRSINWVFTILCLTIATIYLSSLFLVVRTDASLAPPAFPLRWKWAAIAFSSTLYLHLLSFYFPPIWQRYRLHFLIPAYLISGSLALTALFTYWLIGGFRYQSAPHIVSPLPGPLMFFHALFFLFEIILGTVGLIASYRGASSPSLRYQIIYLLIPTCLVFVSGLAHWPMLLAKDLDYLPHELPDALLVLAAFFGAKAVVRYGSFTGRPLPLRNLFYSALAAVAGLIALYLTLSLDQRLMPHTDFPYPPATGLLILAVAAGFPVFSQWVTGWLDRWLFPKEQEQQALIQGLVQTLAETPDPTQLQTELLVALWTVLEVSRGYLALATPDLPAEMLRVQVVYGSLEVQPGHSVRRPVFSALESELAPVLLPASDHEEPGWREINLFCPLTIETGLDGIVALGEKQNGKPFTPEEIGLSTELARQLDLVGRMIHLHEQRNRYLEAARLQEQTLQQLEKEVTVSMHQTLREWEKRTVPLEIRVLGPLQVTREGELVPEVSWGAKKPKHY
jgi:hypothetical protein